MRFSRALLGRSEPYGACRKPHSLVVRFRSPRADQRGMKTSRCAVSVRVPRRSDDASSLENGVFMGACFQRFETTPGQLTQDANQPVTNTLRACFMRAPFFASERVPRRRGQSLHVNVCDLRSDPTSAASPRGLLFSTHARWSDVGCTALPSMKAGGLRTGENKISAGGQKT